MTLLLVVTLIAVLGVVPPSTSQAASAVRLQWPTFLANGLAAVAALASVAVAILVFLTAKRWRAEIPRARQVANIPGLLQEMYTNKRFVDTSGKECTFRDYREGARSVLNACDCADTPACEFHKKSLQDGKHDHNQQTTENRFCYALSLSLQNVGLMAFVGALPLQVVFAMMAPLILEDWGLCRFLVGQIRRDKNPDTGSQGDVTGSFRRRHADWLACVAAIYLKAVWGDSQQTKRLINRAGGADGQLGPLANREKEIRTRETQCMQRSTIDFVMDLRNKAGL
jgi:hypothetical protein